MKKILLGIPTYQGKDYCLVDFMNAIDRLLIPDDCELDVLFVDTSHDTSYKQRLEKITGEQVLRIPPDPAYSQITLKRAHNALRERAIKGKYDYLFHVESDLILRPDTLLLLFNHNKPCVSATYFLSRGYVSHLCLFGFMYSPTGNVGTEEVHTKYSTSIFIGGPERLKQMFASGLGCVLIHKEVFSKIEFRAEVEKSQFHPDMFFYEDLFKLGIPHFVDTQLLLEHRNQDWSHDLKFLTHNQQINKTRQTKS